MSRKGSEEDTGKESKVREIANYPGIKTRKRAFHDHIHDLYNHNMAMNCLISKKLQIKLRFCNAIQQGMDIFLTSISFDQFVLLCDLIRASLLENFEGNFFLCLISP